MKKSFRGVVALAALCVTVMLAGCSNTDSSMSADVSLPETESQTTTTTTATEPTTTTTTTSAATTTTTTTPTTTTPTTTTPETTTTTTAPTTESNGIVTQKASGEMYANCIANVRKGNSTEYDVIMQIPKNKKVKIIGKCDNGWYAVKVDGKTGYMAGSVLSDGKVATTTTKATTTTAFKGFEPDFQYMDESVIEDAQTNYVNRSGVILANLGTKYVRAMEVCGGNKSKAETYAKTLNKYKEALGDSVNVYCMVVPTSAAYYMPAKVGSADQGKYTKDVGAALKGITNVDVYSVLYEHRFEYLYSRSDFHWQPLAAYYSAQELARVSELPFKDISTYKQIIRTGYLGAFYALCNVPELRNSPDYFAYYKPDNLDKCTVTYYNTSFRNGYKGNMFFDNNGISSSYTVFIGTDSTICHVKTDVDNDRTLVIFKDSYGNALVPFLTNSYENIYLCDFRYFDINAIDFIKKVKATDLLFAMSPMASNSSSKVSMIDRNRTR